MRQLFVSTTVPRPGCVLNKAQTSHTHSSTTLRRSRLKPRRLAASTSTAIAVGTAANGGTHSTPRDYGKVGSAQLAVSNTHEQRRAKDATDIENWSKFLTKALAKEMDALEMCDEVMLPLAPECNLEQIIDTMVAGAQSELQAAQQHYKDCPAEGVDENYMAQHLIDVLTALVKGFPESNRPTFHNTKDVPFESLDEDNYTTKPDISATRPGVTTMPSRWPDNGFTIELKKFLDAAQSRSADAAIASAQIGRNGRNHLMSIERNYSFTGSLFGHCHARIFCFDRTAHVRSQPFNWLDGRYFAHFLYRLYNPPGYDGRMDGDDFSVSAFSDETRKEEVYAEVRKIPVYGAMFPTMESALGNSRSIVAVRGRGEERALVHCITIGERTIYQSDGLFSRATRVYRVVILEDIGDSAAGLTVFALKDSWRESSRRPEADFYDLIADYCSKKGIDMVKEGIAQCHGSVDLSKDDLVPEGCRFAQRSRLLKGGPDERRVRHHTRTLITPVGRRLREFKRTKDVAVAFRDAIYHHQIAYEAGVLHRDVSEGNVMFIEAIPADEPQRGFLLDYDYAEFTSAGVATFKETFQDRVDIGVPDLEKSLKNITGTQPFIAIEILRKKGLVQHACHHDLESFNWLLVWIMLRHMTHKHIAGDLACHKLFDGQDEDQMVQQKDSWLNQTTPFDPTHPFSVLADNFRILVRNQNPVIIQQPTRVIRLASRSMAPPPSAAVPELVNHAMALELFDFCLTSSEYVWPDYEPANPFTAPTLRTQSQYGGAKSEAPGSAGSAAARSKPQRSRTKGSQSKRSQGLQPTRRSQPMRESKGAGSASASSTGKRKAREADDEDSEGDDYDDEKDPDYRGPPRRKKSRSRHGGSSSRRA
ncbi:hypothetical protein HMN09_01070600 [Mycena chlorophos]|uniref:Fungal-type protein kinase domain-containing protein n=1 Tax=Mycena chlorophos TaxID=658473 RepID=A0A8H6VWI8_MYCCL|nr:hypothetical protein HMN09_01070600 [Mycena chlorophos]